MSWVKPLEGKSWWAEPAISTRGSNWPKEKLDEMKRRTERRIAQARRLSKNNMSHTQIARQMGVAQSTVTRWLQKG